MLGRLRIRAPPPIDQQPEASEKPLRRIALEDVKRVFDESVQADRQQIQPAKQQQEYDLIQTLAQNLDRESRGFQRIVHDLLGQFQGQIQDRKREKAQHDHLRLLPSGVAQDRAEQPGIKPPHVVHARDRFCRAAPEPQDTAQDEIEGDADQQSRRQDQNEVNERMNPVRRRIIVIVSEEGGDVMYEDVIPVHQRHWSALNIRRVRRGDHAR